MSGESKPITGDSAAPPPAAPDMLGLRCHAPISFEDLECIRANQMTVNKGVARLDPLQGAEWFFDFMEGKLINVASSKTEDGIFYLRRETQWEEFPTAFVEDDLDQIFRKTRLTPLMLRVLRRRTWTSRSRLDRTGNKIFLKNTVLELQNGELTSLPHDPGFYNTYVIDLDYDPSRTDHPLWDLMLERNLPDPDARLLLQEIAGYCLLRNLDYQVFFILFGPPNSGKSTFLDMLNYLLGGRNEPETGKMVSPYVTSRSLETLGDRFGAAGLENSLVNISSESNYLTNAAEGMLKRLTGGDPITIEHKNRDPFTVACSPKMIVATNEIPRFSDRSDALMQRAVFLPFDQPLDLSGAVPNLAASIFSAESSAILNWAIDGLLRLLSRTGVRRERFTLPQSSREAAEQHRRDSNPAADWIEEHLQIDGEWMVDTTSAHKDFLDYLHDNGLGNNHPLRSKSLFVKAVRAELRRLGVDCGKDDRVRRGQFRLRVFRGVKLNSSTRFDTGNYRVAPAPPPPTNDGGCVVTASSEDLPVAAA